MTTGFTVPNRPDAGSLDQAEPDAGDFQALAGDLYGVTSGCAVTQQASPTYTVVVAAGRGVCNGIPVTVPGGNVSLANPSANPRFDLVVFNTAGAVSSISGTADPNPRFPVLVDGFTLIAAVYAPAGALNYANANIVDKRKFLSEGYRRILSSGTSTFLSSRVAGAASDAYQVDATGKATWSGDVSLQRSQATMLQVTGDLAVTRDVTVARDFTVGRILTVQSTASIVASFGGTSGSTDVTNDGAVQASGLLYSQNFKRGFGSPESTPTGVTQGRAFVLGDEYTDTSTGNKYIWTTQYYNDLTNAWVTTTAAWRRIAPNVLSL